MLTADYPLPVTRKHRCHLLDSFSMSEADFPDSERPKIKVTDRRLFDSDGNLRDETPPPPADESTTVPPGEVASAPSREPSEPLEIPSDEAPPEITEDPGVADDVPANVKPRLKLDDGALLKFIEEQYVGGLLALGAMPEPQSGQTVEDLELARLRVEVLGLLQESTEGGRTDDTNKALQDVLYQLRMAYLQKRKVAKL